MGIEIECANARAEARKLIDISEQCGGIKTTVLREKDLIPEYMYGSTGATTMELMQAWCNGLGSIENDLVKLSNTIISIANDMEAAERRRAEQIAAQQAKAFAGVNVTTASHSTSTMQQAASATSNNWTAAVQPSDKKNNNTIKTVIDNALDDLSDLGQSIAKKFGFRRK